MRNGILLAEDSPQNILARFEVSSLEDAFLSLCLRHGVSDEADHTLKQIKTMNTGTMDGEPIDSPEHLKKSIPPLTEKKGLDKNENERNERKASFDSDNTEGCGSGVVDINCNKKSLIKKLQFTTKRRMKALLAKNFLQMFRQPA